MSAESFLDFMNAWRASQSGAQGGTVNPVQAIRDSRSIPAAYQLRPMSAAWTPPTASMTGLARKMGNNQVPTGYFQGQPPQRWQPSQSPMGGLNSGSWLQQYLARMNGE